MSRPGQTARRALRASRLRVRGALWPIPVMAVLAAIGIGIALPALDEVLDQPGGDHPLTFAFGGGPSAARDLLAAIATSLISVTGLTFSLTVVALQLGSSQYSPRLLQTFVSDRVVQATLAALTATYVYALTVLRTVRSEGDTEDETAFVPRLSVTVAYALTLGSVLALVLFLGHLARSLRVETMLRDVHDEAHGTFARELPESGPQECPSDVFPHGEGMPLPAASSGFLTDVDERLLVDAAVETDTLVLLDARIGESVLTDTPVAHVWPRRAGATFDPHRLQQALDQALQLRYERSPSRDIAYSLRKVIDVIGRALSPGINDPTTAVHALSHASALLGDLLSRPLAANCHTDEGGVVRLVVPQWNADELVDLVLEEPLEYAPGQPVVLRRIAALLREVAWRAPGVLDDVLHDRLRKVVDLAAESTRITATERRCWEQRLEAALTHTWPADRPA
jgi:uncharacterized membrane protein